MCEQRLVGGDHVLFAVDGLEHEAPRRAGAAHELDDDVDGRIVEHDAPVGHQHATPELDAAIACGVDVGDADQVDADADFVADRSTLAVQQVDPAGADGPEADEADADGLLPHDPSFRVRRAAVVQRTPAARATVRGAAPSARRMPRIACRVRCSFSIKAKRTQRSPYSPKPIPGDTATFASRSRKVENSSDPIGWNRSGIGAQTNIVAFGFSTAQPARLSPSTSTLRRCSYSLRIDSV